MALDCLIQRCVNPALYKSKLWQHCLGWFTTWSSAHVLCPPSVQGLLGETQHTPADGTPVGCFGLPSGLSAKGPRLERRLPTGGGLLARFPSWATIKWPFWFRSMFGTRTGAQQFRAGQDDDWTARGNLSAGHTKPRQLMPQSLSPSRGPSLFPVGPNAAKESPPQSSQASKLESTVCGKDVPVCSPAMAIGSPTIPLSAMLESV